MNNNTDNKQYTITGNAECHKFYNGQPVRIIESHKENAFTVEDKDGNTWFCGEEELAEITEQPQRKEDKSPTVPLWRRLKSESSKGNWVLRSGDGDNYAELIGIRGSNKTICNFPKKSFVDEGEALANIKYVQLMQHNFANIVEALERIIDAQYNPSKSLANLNSEISNAKDLLSNIS